MYNKYFHPLIVNDVSLAHTFGWSLTGTDTLMETLIGLSRVISTMRRTLSDFPPFLASKNVRILLLSPKEGNRLLNLYVHFFIWQNIH